jgi:hypothetical protein
MKVKPMATSDPELKDTGREKSWKLWHQCHVVVLYQKVQVVRRLSSSFDSEKERSCEANTSMENVY